jgi:hypothetical protein
LLDFEKKTLGNNKNADYTAWDRFKAIYGDHGQAKRLLSAKRSFQTPQEELRRNSVKANYRTPLIRARSITNSDCN